MKEKKGETKLSKVEYWSNVQVALLLTLAMNFLKAKSKEWILHLMVTTKNIFHLWILVEQHILSSKLEYST
jgi:hypothetical protein